MKTLSKLPPAKRLFLLALDDLLKNAHLDTIKTRDIYEAAGMSANTFYYHFQDKYECASLLMKTYQARWHKNYTGSIENVYEYISSGAFIEGYFPTPLDSAIPYSDYLKHGISLEFERVSGAVTFWQSNIHIFKTLVFSYGQNSPYDEYKTAWKNWYKKMLAPLTLSNPVELEYISDMLFQNHETFWKLCILSENTSPIMIERLSALSKKIMFSLIDSATIK